ncbi:MAG: SagB/ThcOx family dehydrogenase [Actinomycetota bacterium]
MKNERLRPAESPEVSIPAAVTAHLTAKVMATSANDGPPPQPSGPQEPLKKSYPRLPRLALPPPEALDATMFACFSSRKSDRAFGADASVQQLSNVLGASCRVSRPRDQLRRTVPSAGGSFSVEVYYLGQGILTKEAGLFHYDPFDHALEVLLQGDAVPRLDWIAPDNTFGVPGAFVLSVLLPRIAPKYGGRGYRYALLEAGAMAQTLDLACRGAGLLALWLGGFDDDRLAEVLDLNWSLEMEAPLIMLGVGNAPPEK